MKKLPKKNQIRHTHFIGISVSEELEQVVFDCRDYMGATYGCKSGYGTPPHITLIAPFTLPDGFTENDIFDACSHALEKCIAAKIFPFEVSVKGFGCFSDRTLFAAVEDSDYWQQAYAIFAQTFTNAIPGSVRRKDLPSSKAYEATASKGKNAETDTGLPATSTRRFYPHLTVANRDIPAGTMDAALKHFAELGLEETFTASSVVIYERSDTGGWQEWKRLEG